jgi:hypothetical protein
MSASFAHGGLSTHTITAADVGNARQIENSCTAVILAAAVATAKPKSSTLGIEKIPARPPRGARG